MRLQPATDIVAFTGHRPNKIHEHLAAIRTGTLEYLTEFRPDEAISGMADGFDMEAALCCLELDIPLTCAVPFKGHHSWTAPEVYDFILKAASRVVYVSQDVYKGPWQLQERNVWMVDNATRLATCWDGTTGGTANCIRYAKKVGRKMDLIWGHDPNA